MSDGERIPYEEAKKVADELVNKLSRVCQRIEIAGSLRRKKATVGDIEIVIIPPAAINLFGDPEDDEEDYALYLIDCVLTEAGCKFVKNGKRYKQVVYDGRYTVDLFITTPEKWGCIFTIRTGSADFTKRLVTKKRYGGLCPDNLQFRDGRIVEDDILLDTPEEIDVFKALGMDYVEPEMRTK